MREATREGGRTLALGEAALDVSTWDAFARLVERRARY
jgi:hypothetical protein